MLSLDRVQKIGLVLIPLGEVNFPTVCYSFVMLISFQASSPTSLTYLTNQLVYVGSHSGDSQLIRVSPVPLSSGESPTLPIPPEIKTVSPNTLEALGHRKGKSKSVAADHMDEDYDDEDDASQGYIVETHGSFIEVLSSYKNLAPILDAILVDTDSSGQVRSLLPEIIPVLTDPSTATHCDMLRCSEHRLHQHCKERRGLPRNRSCSWSYWCGWSLVCSYHAGRYVSDSS